MLLLEYDFSMKSSLLHKTKFMSKVIFIMAFCIPLHAEVIDWKMECAGRMQISLPGSVEVAVMPMDRLLSEDGDPKPRFRDGVVAGYSNFWVGGALRISGPLAQEERKNLWNETHAFQENIIAVETDHGNRRGDIERLNVNSNEVMALRRRSFFHAAALVNTHVAIWRLSVAEDEIRDNANVLTYLLSNVEYRDIYSVPKKGGICAPFLFFPKVDEKLDRLVATTYRLIEHPDITIFLKDKTAGKAGKYERPEVFTAIYKSNFFWTQDYQNYDSIENLLKFRRHNKIPFAGQRGVESMVRMIRPDKITEDFGYLVVTQGDPDAKVDTPDLMLYVIRDAQQAIKRGIKPVPKKEFFKLARQIADSVKHRGALGGEK